MPKTADNCNEIERNNRISAEFQRINVFFEDLPENKKSIVMPLIQNAAFMRVTLDDLQKIIAEQGPVEAYQNGRNQHGMKQSAALQSYNALIKSYTAVTKKMFDLLPPEKRPSPYEIWKRERELDDLEDDEEDDEEPEYYSMSYKEWLEAKQKEGFEEDQ